MDYSALLTFLTEDSIKGHLSHVRQKRLEHSIQEKSIKEIKGKAPLEISRMNIARQIKRQILPRMVYIRSHDTYFSSFLAEARPCPELKKFYPSEDAFCYLVLEVARSAEGGFLYIYTDKRMGPIIKTDRELPEAYIGVEPRLAIDLYEHAYFPDYGYDKERYLRAAISHLNLSALFE